ncbi:MAG: glycosyl hydrolase [Tannerella sp.]|jgi:hypothetical protein|nr:glycosyl hydrolase [Tannerella sp.]
MKIANGFILLSAIVSAAAGLLCCTSTGDSGTLRQLEQGFADPPASARSGVYWYFMDGNFSREAVTKDLEAMKEAGLGHVLFLEVNVGIPRGTVDFLSDEWQELFVHTVRECERLGIGLSLGIGPGWTGSGGPWVKGEESMQHLVHTSTDVQGAGARTIVLPKPQPMTPIFGHEPAVREEWERFYRDVAVLAFPAAATRFATDYVDDSGYLKMKHIEERALYYRKPYSSMKGVKQFLPTYETYAAQPGDTPAEKERIVDLTDRLQPDGSLVWDVPEGEWTVMRFGSRNNGNATRPSPFPGLGLEADKMDTAAINRHLEQFTEKLFRRAGFTKASPDGGLQMLHMDSWEMGSQNWTPRFREAFTQRRGYDPLPFYPVYAGVMVQSREASERFLWDLRQTAQELVLENHAGHVKRYAARYGMGFSIEPYDMTPTSDLELGAVADVPMCEFWSLENGYNTSFSAGEGASLAHIKGQPLVPAESFTSNRDAWRQHPASMKNEGEWAWASGINRFVYHTFAHQSLPDSLRPGMTMGPYGVHWDRNQTWWRLSRAYHDYVARGQFMLQQGRTVADVLYLSPEGAPHVFRAPDSAFEGDDPMMPDRRGYNFDACPPSLLYDADVAEGCVVFPGGASYRLLVLPYFETMTPKLLKKIVDLVDRGATVVGLPPVQSPSLENYPACDNEVKALARELWGNEPLPETLAERVFGRGKIIYGTELKTKADNLYPPYDLTARILSQSVPPDFAATGAIRYTHRTTAAADIYFVSNRTAQPVDAECTFRIAGKYPQLWNPVTGEIAALPEYRDAGGQTVIPLKFDAHEGYFIVFSGEKRAPAHNVNFPEVKTQFTLDAPWTVSFDPKWGGPASTVFDRLHDWTTNPDPGIRYYSGTAVYRQTFDMPEHFADGAICLDLGKVNNIARVRLNDTDLGVVWTAPWRTDISRAVRPEDNRLEIEVVNLWPNRLIGDEQLPYDGPEHGRWPEWLLAGRPRTSGRYAFSAYRHYTKDTPLLESGLTGPVTICTYIYPEQK